MDLMKKTIWISNAYGYSEEIPIVDFLNRMSFSQLKKYPPALQEVILRGMDKNQILILEQIDVARPGEGSRDNKSLELSP
jgi:hypothetical protein